MHPPVPVRGHLDRAEGIPLRTRHRVHGCSPLLTTTARLLNVGREVQSPECNILHASSS
ncbi:hypothetical protein Ae406Ps2_5076 [Pseudonocardia sp. Ae406_Ps2]|nr:hypothetical protein Ae331Ps2_0881c [Pseudonocardia sp. Ae331_Ps2]OLM05076.1 hypothetical protein Ae406Ps2_5076 [Pseudonocardia sp. Ae406_Ps2]OLM10111.1 hypothetical protein Ae505Ps2_0233c [Pseudonocardia sp. Ae505_Ps2]